PGAEQERQRAPAGEEGLRLAPALAAWRRRPDELVRFAPSLRVLDSLVDVVAEGDRWPAAAGLPRRREGHGVEGPAVEAPGVIRPLEPAAAEAAKHDVAAAAQDHQVDRAVAIDVDGVGAGHKGEVGRRIADPLEAKLTADRGDIAEQPGRVRAAGHVHVR